MRAYFITLIFLILQIPIYAQNQAKIDSLQLLLKKEVSKKEKVDLYNLLALEYRQSDSTQVVHYTQLAKKLAKEINYPEALADADYHLGWITMLKGHYQEAEDIWQAVLKHSQEISYERGKGNAFNGLGVVNWYQGDYNQAKKNYEEALRVAEIMGDKKGRARAYNNIGIIYIDQNKYAQALDYYFKSLSIHQDMGNKRGVAGTSISIGNVYNQQAKYEKALHHYQKGLKYWKELGDRRSIASSYYNLGLVYKSQKKYEKALDYFFTSLEIQEDLGIKADLAFCYHSIGNTKGAMKNYDQAFEYLDKALSIRKELGQKSRIIENYVDLGFLMYNMKEYQRAIDYLDKFLSMAKEIGHLNSVRNGAEVLAKSYFALHRYKEAYEAKALYQEIADSLFMEKNSQQISLLEAEYAFRQERDSLKFVQEKERMAFEEANQRRYVIQLVTYGCLGVVTFIVVIISYFYWDKRKNNRKLAHSNQQLAEANQALKSSNHEMSQSNEELNQTLDQLKNAQKQLIQAEKMASLGQLTAGIAHEINTPLGVIKAAIKIIQDSVEESLGHLPNLFQILNDQEQRAFLVVIQESLNNPLDLSSREERQRRKELTKSLEQTSLPQSDEMVHLLIDANIHSHSKELEILLRHPQSEFILKIAYHLANLKRSGANIDTAIQKAARTVFALKTYTHFSDKGQMEIIQVSENINTILTLYHNQIKQGIEVIKEYEDLPAIPAYPDELSQVWTNLLQNAIQAMDGQGCLTIRIFKLEARIWIEFEDKGPGISPEIQDKIFDPFFTTKPRGEGSGLGLYIVQQIVEKHQGEITFHTKKGAGTTFKVGLPLG